MDAPAKRWDAESVWSVATKAIVTATAGAVITFGAWQVSLSNRVSILEATRVKVEDVSPPQWLIDRMNGIEKRVERIENKIDALLLKVEK